jgi:hypothetical protein
MRAVLIGFVLCLSVVTIGHAAPATPSSDALTFSEGIYVGEVLMTMDLLGDSMSRYTDAISTPNPLDPVWRAEAGAEPRMWQAIANRFILVNPPPRFADMHTQLLAALDALALAADHCINGIDNLDADAVTDCTAGIEDATDLMNAVKLPVMPAAP